MGIGRKLVDFLDVLETKGATFFKIFLAVLAGLGIYFVWQEARQAFPRGIADLLLLVLGILLFLILTRVFRRRQRF